MSQRLPSILLAPRPAAYCTILHDSAPYGWILHSQLPSAPFRTMAHLQVGAASAGAAFSHLCGHPRVDLTCDHSLAASVSGESRSAWQCVSTLPTCLTNLDYLDSASHLTHLTSPISPLGKSLDLPVVGLTCIEETLKKFKSEPDTPAARFESQCTSRRGYFGIFWLSNFRSIWPSSCLPQSESLYFFGHPNQTIVWDH